MGSRPRLVHIVLQTGQVDAMRDWYCAVVNAHVVYAGHHLTFLTHDDEHHRIALLEMPPGMAERKSPATAAMHHSAWTFDNPDEATGYMEGPEYDFDAVGPSFDVQ